MFLKIKSEDHFDETGLKPMSKWWTLKQKQILYWLKSENLTIKKDQFENQWLNFRFLGFFNSIF